MIVCVRSLCNACGVNGHRQSSCACTQSRTAHISMRELQVPGPLPDACECARASLQPRLSCKSAGLLCLEAGPALGAALNTIAA